MAREAGDADNTSTQETDERSLEGFTKEPPIEIRPKEFVTDVEDDR
jgi:hypothetical protein